MKKLIVIIFFLMFMTNVNAMTGFGGAAIDCDKTNIYLNDVVNCRIDTSTFDEISAISGKLTANGSISISNIKTNTEWQGDGQDGNIQLYTDVNKDSPKNIISFTITGTELGIGNISLKDVVFTDKNFEEWPSSYDEVTKEISVLQIPAEIGKCNDITYNGSEQVLATGGTHIEYKNNLATKAGNYDVVFETENGYVFSDGSTSKILTCKINKANMIISKKDYVGTYDGQKHTFELNTKPNSNVEIFYNSVLSLTSKNYSTIGKTEKPELSEEGKTTVYYYIHDKSGNYNDYSSDYNKNNALITISKKEKNELDLSALSINGNKIELIPGIYEYEVMIDEETPNLEILATPLNKNAKIVLPEDLKVSETEKSYEVKVTLDDGSTQIYKILSTLSKSGKTDLIDEKEPKQEMVENTSKINKRHLIFAISSIVITCAAGTAFIIFKKRTY